MTLIATCALLGHVHVESRLLVSPGLIAQWPEVSVNLAFRPRPEDVGQDSSKVGESEREVGKIKLPEIGRWRISFYNEPWLAASRNISTHDQFCRRR